MDRASHECQGLKSSTEGGMDQMRGALGEKIEALSMAVGKKVGGLTDDVAALNDSLSQEKADRTTGDATLNTKLLEQVELLPLTRQIKTRVAHVSDRPFQILYKGALVSGGKESVSPEGRT